jgi:Tfp pilus assembly protein PilW
MWKSGISDAGMKRLAKVAQNDADENEELVVEDTEEESMPEEDSYIIHEVSSGRADTQAEYKVKGYGIPSTLEKAVFDSKDKALEIIYALEELSGARPSSIFFLDNMGKTTFIGWTNQRSK